MIHHVWVGLYYHTYLWKDHKGNFKIGWIFDDILPKLMLTANNMKGKLWGC